MQSTAKEIRAALYNHREYHAAILAAEAAISSGPSPEERRNLLALIAWCHYQRAEWNLAFSFATQGDPNEWAKKCEAHLRAYRAKFTDDVRLAALVAELPDDASVANALVTRARYTDCDVDAQAVLSHVHKWRETGNDINVAHLHNNAARYLHAKGWDGEASPAVDFQAIALLQEAIARYSVLTNWDHRAGAHYWMAILLDRQQLKASSLSARRESVRLWEQAILHDPTNIKFERAYAQALRDLADYINPPQKS